MGKKRGPSIMLDERPNLTIVHDRDGDGPTEGEIGQILGEMIDRGIPMSLEAALQSAALVAKAKAIWEAREAKRLKELGEKARKEAEEALRRKEAEERRALAAAEAALDQMLEAETAPPAPPEAITAFVEAIKTKGSDERTVVARPDVVKVQDLVTEEFDGIAAVEPIQTLKQKFGTDLPELVFLCWQLAAAFRGWLAKYKKRVLDTLKIERQKLSSEQDGDFVKTLEERIARFDGLFEKINEVITGGWSKDPKKDMAEPSFFFQVEKELGGSSKFSYLREVPRRLTPEERQKQADEAKAREAAVKAREQCVVAVRNRLTTAGFSVDEAEKMATSWLRKWDGGLNVVEILTTKAINLAISGENDRAKRVAKSAGIETVAFDALVGAKQAELAELAAKQAAAALANRGPQAGAMSPRAKPKSKKDEGNKKKRGGQGDRRR